MGATYLDERYCSDAHSNDNSHVDFGSHAPRIVTIIMSVVFL